MSICGNAQLKQIQNACDVFSAWPGGPALVGMREASKINDKWKAAQATSTFTDRHMSTHFMVSLAVKRGVVVVAQNP